jgi:hypothetical protein
MACCVFIAFLIGRMISAVAWLSRPVSRRLRPEPVAPAVVSVSGGRFVRT